jgi:predicted DNA-binding protein with PD1-like motif/glutaredoxin
MRALPLHLEAGADIRRSLEALAQQQKAEGFVPSVVGNLRRACFACPGRNEPTVLEGELEIITLQGTIGPGGVHLHLSFSDTDCQVWGGHLEHGSQIHRGADLLVGFLNPPTVHMPVHSAAERVGSNEPRVQITVAEGCPWSARALRMLRSLGIPHRTVVSTAWQVPQISIDGAAIGGYDALAELHGRGGLEALRQP